MLISRKEEPYGFGSKEYRAKWGLPADYPMVAPNYAAKRSELARSSGLGQMRRKTAAKAAAAQEETVTVPAETSKPKRRAPAKKKASE
jgi:predicted transcriptional regulator